MDPVFGGFVQPVYGDDSCFCTLQCQDVRDMERLLVEEIKTVARLSHEKTKKLRHATDVHCGLVIMHLFVSDLLGVRFPLFLLLFLFSFCFV